MNKYSRQFIWQIHLKKKGIIMKKKTVRLCAIFLLLTLTACETEQDKAEPRAEPETILTENSEKETPKHASAETPEIQTTTKPQETCTQKSSEPLFQTIEQSGLTAFFADSDEETTPFGLSLISESENNISEPEYWLAENHLYLPMINGILAESAMQIYQEPTIDYDYWKQYTINPVFFDKCYIYEWSPTEICVYDPAAMQLLYKVQTASDRWNLMGNCAYVRDGILYIGSIYNGYAMENSCYLMAYDIENGELLWRSDDQTYNSMNFIVKGDVIICGYGFTAEPDYIYQISMHTGKVLSKTAVAKMPDLLVEQDGLLYVHTYSYDYIFEIEETNP